MTSVSALRPQVKIVDKDGGPSVREQIKTQERGLAAKEQTALAACPDDTARGELKQKFTQARAERGRKYAAMLCSTDGWVPKSGCSAEGKVLTGFYQLLGQRGREMAAKEKKPFSMAYLDRVQLSRDDVEGLRKQFGDEAVKKAMPLLKKHIASGSWLSKAALRFMMSSEFVAYQTMLAASHDKMERDVHTHDTKLDEADAMRLRDAEHAADKKRQLGWTSRIVVESHAKADGKRERQQLAVAVGGHLIPLKTLDD